MKSMDISKIERLHTFLEDFPLVAIRIPDQMTFRR